MSESGLITSQPLPTSVTWVVLSQIVVMFRLRPFGNRAYINKPGSQLNTFLDVTTP